MPKKLLRAKQENRGMHSNKRTSHWCSTFLTWFINWYKYFCDHLAIWKSALACFKDFKLHSSFSLVQFWRTSYSTRSQIIIYTNLVPCVITSASDIVFLGALMLLITSTPQNYHSINQDLHLPQFRSSIIFLYKHFS